MYLKLFFILISVILGVVGQLSFKQGMLSVGEISKNMSDFFPFFLKAAQNIYIWIGFICYGISFFVWLGILSKVELSYARPLVASGYVFIALLSWLIWNENLTVLRWIGIILISIGVVFVSRS